ncbi:cytochrome P450 [Westerdykella ornata]|uniref:Cytochrome P450 n=1 Tax=Westerdykella ornata TaxID=318751 RepID=A0A6A6JBN9_WESOR|nr:cytochrome P450 [Westerdykella ornata]KAF2274030.1 cytochrome P450 [Westerdykella ornata]
MFGGTDAVVEALRQDNSGIGAKPYSGSNVHPGRRLLRNQILFFSDAFSKSSLDELVPRFVQSLKTWCEASDEIGTEWVEKSDLYEFVRDVLFDCNVDSFFGKSLRALNPNLSADFWEYDDNIGFLATPKPRWLNRRAVLAMERCHAAMKRWRKNAVDESAKRTISDDAAWDPAWGLGAIRRRNKLLDATEGLFDEHNRGSIDLALLWSLTSNVIPASFWYLFEVLSSEGLLARAVKEIEKQKQNDPDTNDPVLDSTERTTTPLLEAIYAETVRLHVITLITRTVKKSYSVEGWILPQNQNVIVSSQIEHMSRQWDSPDGKHPSSEFWPDRFLLPESSDTIDEEEKFSLEGRQGQWIPFGLGEHMCPGRHFAKQEMIISFAVLTHFFEFELLTPPGWRPDNDLSRYGFGTQQPKQKVPFRVRRRTS